MGKEKSKKTGHTSGGRVHDWSALELEFLSGKWLNVSSFLRDKGLSASGYVNRKTAGWAIKKQKRGQEILAIASEDVKRKHLDNLERGYKNLINAGVLGRLTDPVKLSKMSYKEIETLWKILRTENGLPTAIKHVGEDEKAPFESWVNALKEKLPDSDDEE